MVIERRSESLLHRLIAREVQCARPGTQIHRVRQLYENVVPSHTVFEVECPDHTIRRFSHDGQYLICFSRNGHELIVYRHHWLSYCTKGDDDSLEDPEGLPPKAKTFEGHFTHLYSVNLAPANELLCKDFFLCTDSSAYGIFVTSSALENNAPSGAGTVPGVPSMEKITFLLVRLSDGHVCDKRTFQDDYIHLSHNAGVFLYDDLLAILSIRYQSIHILQVRENSGLLVDARVIGTHCREDDELVLHSQIQEEERFQREQAAIRKARRILENNEENEFQEVSMTFGGGLRGVQSGTGGTELSGSRGWGPPPEAEASGDFHVGGGLGREDVSNGVIHRRSMANGSHSMEVEMDTGLLGNGGAGHPPLTNFRTVTPLNDNGNNNNNVRGTEQRGPPLFAPYGRGHGGYHGSFGGGGTFSIGGIQRFGSGSQQGRSASGGSGDRAGGTTSMSGRSGSESGSSGGSRTVGGTRRQRMTETTSRMEYVTSNRANTADISMRQLGFVRRTVGAESGEGGATEGGGRRGGQVESSEGHVRSILGVASRGFIQGGRDTHLSNVVHNPAAHNQPIGRSPPPTGRHSNGNNSDIPGSSSQGVPERSGAFTMGNARHMEGNSRHVEGNTRHFDGNSRHFDGNSRHFDGNSRHVEGNARHVEGNVRHVEGNSRHVEGNTRHYEDGHMGGTVSHGPQGGGGRGRGYTGSEQRGPGAVTGRVGGREAREGNVAGTIGGGDVNGGTRGVLGEGGSRERDGGREGDEELGPRGQGDIRGLEGGGGGEVIGGIKQRLLTHIFQGILAEEEEGSPRGQRLKRFYYHFQHYMDLVMWKVQFLDRSHLLIKFGSVDGVALRNSENSHQNAFFAVYNLESTEMVGFFPNSSSQFLSLVERHWEQFLALPALPLGPRLASSPGNNCHARDRSRRQSQMGNRATQGGAGQAMAIKRTLASLPFNAQSQSPSVYFDQSLFHFDDKLISATDRHRPCMEHPIKFISRRRPNALKFKINPGVEVGPTDGRVNKRVASYIFHPILPFAISIQQSFMQSPVINFHFRK